MFSQLELAKGRWDIAQFVYLYTGQRSSKRQQVHLQHRQSVLLTAKYFRRYFIFRYKTHIILILSFKSYPIFEHLTSFMEQLLMYFQRHKRKERNVIKGHFATKSFRPLDVSAPRHFGPRLFLCTITFKSQGITMAETVIIILAEHNVPINFADHFTKLVSNKLVFPDSVFLRTCSFACAARAPCSLKVGIARVVTNFFPET